MAELFQTTPQNINLHLQNIYEEGELAPAATIMSYLMVRTEGTRQARSPLQHYSLDAIARKAEARKEAGDWAMMLHIHIGDAAGPLLITGADQPNGELYYLNGAASVRDVAAEGWPQ
jgi:hypothetical protein